MTMINSMLLGIQNQAPALLQVGGNRTENYQNLAALTGSLLGDSQWLGSIPASDRSQDVVNLAYQSIGQKVVSDMAGLTASAILDDPGLDNDYFIALLETGAGREARVYRRSEILAAFEGSDAEKKALDDQLAADPLQVFTSAQGLPPGSSDPACQNLASQLTNFLKINAKTLGTLKSAGFDPFQDFPGTNTARKALAAYLAAVAAGE